jgi:hypothetical protein
MKPWYYMRISPNFPEIPRCTRTIETQGCLTTIDSMTKDKVKYCDNHHSWAVKLLKDKY